MPEKPKLKSEKSSEPLVSSEQLQQKYLQFQLYQQQIEKVSQQLEVFTQQFADLEVSQEALEKLKTLPLDNEILALLAPGIFIKASLKDNRNLIINVGANLTVEKTPAQVLEMLESQKRELEAAISQSDALLQAFTQQALKLYRELEKAEKEAPEKQNVRQT